VRFARRLDQVPPYLFAEIERRIEAMRAEGVDVVVGWVETHGRAETAALLEGLEILPPRLVEYRGTTLHEFDLDAALAELSRNGVDVLIRPGEIGGWYGWREAFVKDPNGIWIELVQRK